MNTKAFLLDNQSLTLRRLPDGVERAIESLNDAFEIQIETGDRRGGAFTQRNKGTLLLRIGRVDEAESAIARAVLTFEDIGYESGHAAALASLAEVYELRGDYARAAECLNKSMAISPTRNPNRTSMNYGQISRVRLKQGDIDAAQSFAEKCATLGQEIGTSESVAAGLHAVARVSLAQGNFRVARNALEDALDGFNAVNNRQGVASVLMDLARVAQGLSELPLARSFLEQATAQLELAPHYALRMELEELRSDLVPPSANKHRP